MNTQAIENPSKQTILQALDAFVSQRPGLDFANYGDVSIYRSESRSITKDRHHAEALLAAIGWRDNLTAEDLLAAFSAYSGRLSYSWDGESFSLNYCTGQYFPTEYRKAVCAILSSALWHYWASDLDTGDQIRKAARDNLSQGVARTWFN